MPRSKVVKLRKRKEGGTELFTVTIPRRWIREILQSEDIDSLEYVELLFDSKGMSIIIKLMAEEFPGK